jgi:RNA polymerase sigma-70 factor (ECF subfamily)
MVVTRGAGARDGRGVQVGDLAEFYDKHADALTGFAATLVGPTHAEDVVSEALVGILRTSPDAVADLRACCYRSRAERWSQVLAIGASSAVREYRSTIREMVQLPDADAIADALARLSPQQRAVIHLTYWEDLTPSVVAGRLGVSDGTVRRRLARARRRLAEALHGAV